MTFVPPTATQQLHVKVSAAFGSTMADDPGTWVWTDITRWVRVEPPVGQPVTLSGGRASIAGQADPSQISLSLDNTDGRFTARNPRSPYWPNVVRNVPLQVAVTWDGAAGTYELLTAFVNGWPLQPNAGVLNVSVPITASGRLRRMRRSNQTVASALFRAITLENGLAYDGYWPMEDLAGSSQFAHGPVQSAPLRDIPIGGISRVTLAASTAVPGSKALPDFSRGQNVTAQVTPVNNGLSQWNVFHALFVGDTPSGSGLVTLTRTFFNGGSWRVSLDLSGANWQIDFIDRAGAVTNVASVSWASTVNPFDGQPHLLKFNTQVVGGTDLASSLAVDGQNIAVGTTIVSVPQSPVYKVGVAGTVTSFPLVIGHLAVFNRAATIQVAALLGNAGELATARVSRLCIDAGIPLTRLPDTPAGQPMGPQRIDTLANLLDEVADVDNGLLHDAGPNGNLVYVSGTARYNAAIAMTLDYTRHQIGDGLASTYDDQDLVTEWTVSRDGGSSANYKAADATDDYASQATVNAASDTQLADIAGWRTHEGTFDAYRLPAININMRKTPELAQAATSLQLPARISPVNLPLPYPPESLDQFAEGFSTVIDTVQWETTYACQPYGPWQVGVYGTSRYDSGSSTLLNPVGSSDTSLQVATADPDDVWTTDPTQWAGGQMLVRVGGSEVMRVTNIAGVVFDNFARTVTNGWGTADTGQPWSTSGGSASDYSVSSGSAVHSLGSVGVVRASSLGSGIVDFDGRISFRTASGVFPSGAALRVALAAHYGSNSNNYQFLARVETDLSVTAFITRISGGAESVLASVTVPGLTFASNTFFRIRGQIFGSTLRIKVWRGTDADEPTGWTLSAIDTLTPLAFDGVAVIDSLNAGNTNTLPVVISYDAFSVDHPQVFTVVRGAGGVQMPHAAGDQVHVSPQATYAL